MTTPNNEEINVLEEDGIRKVGISYQLCIQNHTSELSMPLIFSLQAICGYTWPGIEFGEPPSCPYTFFEVRNTIAEKLYSKFRNDSTISWQAHYQLIFKIFPKIFQCSMLMPFALETCQPSFR
jgi:hypothetical protein